MLKLATDREACPTAVLVVVCAAQFICQLDVFVVNVALPSIGVDLGSAGEPVPVNHLSWILAAYSICYAALLVAGGRLADRFGQARVFLTGLLFFVGGSLGCALSGDVWWIVGFRVVQALGAALLTPSSLGLVLTTRAPERRAAGVKVWAVVGSLGAAAGPAVGGLLTEWSWRWVFIINVPIGVTVLALFLITVPRMPGHPDAVTPSVPGVLCLVVGMSALTLTLVQGPTWTWDAAPTVISALVAVAGLAAACVHGRRSPNPLIPQSILQASHFVPVVVTVALTYVAFAGTLLGVVLQLEEGEAWSALRTGLAIAPGPVMVTVSALGLSRLTRDAPARLIAALGAACAALGAAALAAGASHRMPYWQAVLPGWLLIGLGIGFLMPTLMAAATNALPSRLAATGSSVAQMCAQLGSVVGVCVLVMTLGQGDWTWHRATNGWWLATALFGAVAVAALITLRPSREPEGV